MKEKPVILKDPFVCSQCASQGMTCCSLVPGNEEYACPTSTLERERIYAAYKGECDAFTQTPNSPAFLEQMKQLFPDDEATVTKLFAPDKDHFRLKTDASGTCVLLSETGCTIERGLRPYYCQLFPLWYAQRSLQILVSSNCLAQRQYTTKPALLKELNLSSDQVRQLYKKLRQAWGLPV